MFCSQCGVNVGETSKYCSNCGALVLRENNQVRSEQTPALQESAKLRIEMESQPMLIKLGKMEVMLDGQVISKDLWFGKTIELVLTEMGHHTLQITFKLVVTRKSEVLHFQVLNGQLLSFEGLYSNVTGGISLVQL